MESHIPGTYDGNAPKAEPSKVNSSADTKTDERQLVQQIPIADTPFHAIKHDGQWFLALGKYRISEILPSLEHVIEDAQKTDWDRLVKIMTIVTIEQIALYHAQHNSEVVKDKAQQEIKFP